MRTLLAAMGAALLIVAVPAGAMVATPVGAGERNTETIAAEACRLTLEVDGRSIGDHGFIVRGHLLTVRGEGFSPSSTVLLEATEFGSLLKSEPIATDAAGTFRFDWFFPDNGQLGSQDQIIQFAAYDSPSHDTGSCFYYAWIQVRSSMPFADIAWEMFRGDITWIYYAGVTAGCGGDDYCPRDWVSREQMASFLVRALELPATDVDYFTDDEDTEHEGDINRLAAAGITVGCTADRFCPRDIVWREQMASFLTRAFDLPPTDVDYFVDDDTSMHEAAINSLAAAGITSGAGPGQFAPRRHVDRGQMAAFLHRAMTE